MRQAPDETPMDFLRRLVENMGYEEESLLDDLPNVQAILDYADLWSAYGTEYLEGILECIAEGADPTPYNDFVNKHQIKWVKFGTCDGCGDVKLQPHEGLRNWIGADGHPTCTVCPACYAKLESKTLIRS